MGQGSFTELVQIATDELEVEINQTEDIKKLSELEKTNLSKSS